MSIQVLSLSVTTSDGVVHPNAIAEPATVIMNNLEQLGGVDWVFYHDINTFSAKDQPISFTHHTNLNTTLYNQVVSFPVPSGVTNYGQITAIALIYLAQNVKDIQDLNVDGTPILDINNNPVYVSFFENAQVITVG